MDLWKEDGGTSSEWPYKNVPFFQARRWRLDQPPQADLAPGGLGGPTFCGPTERGDVERVQSSVPGETLEYFLIYGPTPMAPGGLDPPDNVPYLLRLWRVWEGERDVWRASLQHPGSGQRVSFRTLEELCGFLWRETGTARDGKVNGG